MAFGLPVAVTVGWVLAGPATQPSAAKLPGGSGGLGAAPQRATASEPVTAVRYSSRPFRPPASAAVSTPVSPSPAASGAPVVIPSAPAPSSSPSALPILTNPPVPTPTEITSTPSAAPPSGDPSATASDPS